MSRPSKNKNAQVDQRNAECLLLEQQMDACLDGRDSISTLASDPHLDRCPRCRISFDIYRQFDSAGGAVLNGGAVTLLPQRQERSSRLTRGWVPLSSVALTLALVIYAVVSMPGGGSSDPFSAISVSSNMTSVDSNPEEVGRLESEADAQSQRWDPEYLVQLGSAMDDSQPQSMLPSLREVRTISQGLLSSNLVSSIIGKPGSGWRKPWQYTSELPGIRPFHQSVNVALVLYNDSKTVL